MRRTIPLALGGALVLGACAGPQAPFDVGTQTAQVNLVLGVHEAVQTAPVGPISAPIPPALAPFVPVVPAPVQPPPRVVSPAAPSPVPAASPSPSPSASPTDACPTASSIAPTIGTTVELPGPPSAGTYTYRASTSDTVGDQVSKYVGPSTWVVGVGAVDAKSGGYDVTIATSIGASTTTRVLRVLPEPDTSADLGISALDNPTTTDPNYYLALAYNEAVGRPLPAGVSLPGLGRYGPAGIYLVSQTSGASTFTPSTPIPLVQTPAAAGTTFTGFGTDGTTSMLFVSTVTKKVNVDACGTKIESWEVTLTDGHIGTLASDGSSQDLDFSETLDFGFQFGGLPLHDAGTVSGSTGSMGTSTSVARTFDFTVDARPKPAKV